MIKERLGEPYIFGYATVRILHHQDISARTKQKIAEYTVAITRPGGEYGMPHGLLGHPQPGRGAGCLCRLDAG
jgi:hypothetical protein